MAAKTHVDSSVGERRLRPIYDWLDNGNNKKALQEAEKVLKKQPNFLCAKVLKALALLRLGKEEDCEQLLEIVKTEVPADDATLQAMTICYREVHRPEKICEIYESAVKKESGNEELLTHLFMAYVRVADYKKQQQTALQLYKLKPKNPYYFWAVMSVVMQAYKAEDHLAKTVVLPLAERMVKKFVNEDKIEAEQEVQLYLMILEMQAKYEEALQVLEGPLGEKLVSHVFVPLKRASLLMKLERWRETNILYKMLLKDDMDRWSYISDYLTTALKLFDSGQQNGNNNNMDGTVTTTTRNNNNNINNNQAEAGDHEAAAKDEELWHEPDTSPAACSRFLNLLVTLAEQQARRLRGPYLARLELYRLLTERGLDPQQLLGDVSDLLLGYVRHFAEKPCCVSDLRRFLPLLPSTQRSSFLQSVVSVAGLGPAKEAHVTPNQLQRHVCSLQLSRALGMHLGLSEAQREALVIDLLHHYESGSGLNTDTLQTEFACNDPYVLLAAHVLYDSWLETGQSRPLLQAIQVLELALSNSPSNFHVKLLLLRLYGQLGAGGAAHRIYEQLDVKHMQLDSLGYFYCGGILATGQLTTTAALYEATLKFFTANYKDSVDHLTFSYKFGSFLKIEEFVEFRERLNNSLHYALTTVERMLLELLSCSSHAHTCQVLASMEVQAWKDIIEWDVLQDNRDTSIIINWEPACRQLSPEQLRQSFLDDKQLLRLRSLLLRMLAASLEVSQTHCTNSGVTNGKESQSGRNMGLILGTLRKELSHIYQLFQHLLSQQKSPPREFVTAPPTSRLHGYISADVIPPLLEMFGIVESLATGPDDWEGIPRTPETQKAQEMLEQIVTSAAEKVGLCVSNLVTSIEAHSVSEDPLAGQRALLERTVVVSEMLGQAVLVCGACHALIRPLHSPLVRKGKKKKDHTSCSQNTSSVGPVRVSCFSKLVTTLMTSGQALDNALSQWETNMLFTSKVYDNLSQRLAELSLAQHGNVEQSNRLKSDINGHESVTTLTSTKLADSFHTSLCEIRQVVQSKLQYLASFRV